MLKNAIDHTFPEWQHKPVTFVSWGNVGGDDLHWWATALAAERATAAA